MQAIDSFFHNEDAMLAIEATEKEHMLWLRWREYMQVDLESLKA